MKHLHLSARKRLVQAAEYSRRENDRRDRVLDFVRMVQSPPPTDHGDGTVTYRIWCPFHRSRKPEATFTAGGRWDSWRGFDCPKCWEFDRDFTKHIESLSKETKQ